MKKSEKDTTFCQKQKKDWSDCTFYKKVAQTYEENENAKIFPLGLILFMLGAAKVGSTNRKFGKWMSLKKLICQEGIIRYFQKNVLNS